MVSFSGHRWSATALGGVVEDCVTARHLIVNCRAVVTYNTHGQRNFKSLDDDVDIIFKADFCAESGPWRAVCIL